MSVSPTTKHATRRAIASVAALASVPIIVGLLTSPQTAVAISVAVLPAAIYGVVALRGAFANQRASDLAAAELRVLNAAVVEDDDPPPASSSVAGALDQALQVARGLERQRDSIAAQRTLLNHEFYGASMRRFHSEGRAVRRLVSELHDSVAQDLTLARWALSDDSPGSAAAIEAIESAERTLRNFMHSARPAHRPTSLYTAVGDAITSARQRYGIGVTLHWAQGNWLLSDEAVTVILHFLQEALHNVAKHSGHSNADLTVAVNDADGIYVSVLDYGNYDPELRNQPAGGHHIGLRGLSERAQAAGGTVSLTRSDEGGALAVLSLGSDHVRPEWAAPA